MLGILKAIKLIIERFIVNKVPIRENVSSGSTSIPLVSSRRFCVGDSVVIHNGVEFEVKEIVEIPSNLSITVDSPLLGSYTTATGVVQKIEGVSNNSVFIDGVYLGEPEVIMRFPAITITPRSRSTDWLTLESTQDEFTIDITLYVTGADYETQLELMLKYTEAIENSLFRSFYPLVEPYDYTTLAQDVSPSDTVIQVTDPDFFTCGLGWIFLENYDFLRSNGVSQDLGGGALRLKIPAGASFSAGDKIIRPREHIFSTMPSSTEYGIVSRQGAMLHAAKISYSCKREVLRYTPYIDPLTF